MLAHLSCNPTSPKTKKCVPQAATGRSLPRIGTSSSQYGAPSSNLLLRSPSIPGEAVALGSTNNLHSLASVPAKPRAQGSASIMMKASLMTMEIRSRGSRGGRSRIWCSRTGAMARRRGAADMDAEIDIEGILSRFIA